MQPAPAACPPVQVSVVVDKTGSADRNRTPQPDAAAFDPLYELLLQCGGEIAAGVFGSRDNGPLLRLRIDPPAAPPAPADPTLNPLQYDDQRREERKARALADSANLAREKDAYARIQAFDAELEPLLGQATAARCSDIAAGLRRMARFHNEPASNWAVAPRKYLIAVSDGDHNCGPQTLDPVPGVRVLAVNGAPGLGILAELHAVPLESYPAALHLIAAETATPRRKE